MDIATLQAIVDRGEDGQHQFKSDVSNINALAAGLLHGDEIPAKGLTVSDLDKDYFAGFLQKHFNTDVNTLNVPLPTLLENMNLMRDGTLNVAGALLFTRNPSFYLPTFVLKAIAFPGNTIDVNTYLDSQDMSGKLLDVFQQTLSFVMRNLHHVQAGQNVNSLGELEIPRVVFEELITNALIHRDYFVSATIRLFIFKDRIEIISPGHLPNNLTITKIKLGNSNIRNPILVSFASRILPYRGLGSGIVRALSAYPDIEFVDDRENNLFKAIIKRPPFPALP